MEIRPVLRKLAEQQIVCFGDIMDNIQSFILLTVQLPTLQYYFQL